MNIMYYFAYGSNMDEDQMQERCPYSQKKHIGVLRDHKLFFSHNSKKFKGGVLSVKKEENQMVQGVIYEITSEDLRNLDYFEGYPKVYDRKLVQVEIINPKTDKVTTKNCWVYYSCRIEENVKPSEYYLEIVKEAHEKNKTTLLL